MNCKQIDELLPLYAGSDLDSKRARLVGQHIEICSRCASTADEYRETVALTQSFFPPVFADREYATLRGQVLRRIKDEPPKLLLPQVFGSWFRPQMAWATAGALIIALGFFALYLVVNRPGDVEPLASRPTVIEYSRPVLNPPMKTLAAQKASQIQRKISRGFVNRSSWAIAKAQNSSAATSARDSQDANGSTAVDAAPSELPLRVEIQTKDPNIRIIWFSQSNSKPALPNAKGI